MLSYDNVYIALVDFELSDTNHFGVKNTKKGNEIFSFSQTFLMKRSGREHESKYVLDQVSISS